MTKQIKPQQQLQRKTEKMEREKTESKTPIVRSAKKGV